MQLYPIFSMTVLHQGADAMDFQTTVGELPKKVQELNLPPNLTIQISFRDKDMPIIPDHLIPKEQKPRNYRREVWQEMHWNL